MENKRNTEQKRIIYDALMSSDHPTASELYELVRAKYPRVSRATVFRVLGQFADDGSALRLNFVGSDTRFDARTAPHAHCRCTRCGRVCDVLEGKVLQPLGEREVQGFLITSAALEFMGVCPDCRAALGETRDN